VSKVTETPIMGSRSVIPPVLNLRGLLPELVKVVQDCAFRIALRVLSSDRKLHWPMIKLTDGHVQSY